MAHVTYGSIITDIKGSVGGNTFQHNRSGKIIRLRPATHKHYTNKQSEAIQYHLRAIIAYSKLSTSDKKLWDDFATTHDRTNVYGETKTLTSQNWFESINHYRYRLSLSQFSSPPAYILPRTIPAYSIVFSATTIIIRFTSSFDTGDDRLIIFTTSPILTTTLSFRSSIRLTVIKDAGIYNDIDITTDWENAHNLDYPPSSGTDVYNMGVVIQALEGTSFISSEGLFIVEEHVL